MFPKKRDLFSRRRFLGAFSGATSAILLIGSNGESPRRRIREFLNEIEVDALIRSAPKRAIGFSCRSEEGCFVLVNEATAQEVCRFNETGRFVWGLCNGEKTPSEISGLLTAAYEVAPDRANQDCLFFLAVLRDRGAIQV